MMQPHEVAWVVFFEGLWTASSFENLIGLITILPGMSLWIFSFIICSGYTFVYNQAKQQRELHFLSSFFPPVWGRGVTTIPSVNGWWFIKVELSSSFIELHSKCGFDFCVMGLWFSLQEQITGLCWEIYLGIIMICLNDIWFWWQALG